MPTSDVTPTEHLIMEVLAARARLGERCWTFPTTVRPALRRLADRGLVTFKAGVQPQTCLAWMTDDGRHEWMSVDYTPPVPADDQQPTDAPSPVVLTSAVGHGVHHLLDDTRRETYCGYRVRSDDRITEGGLPPCPTCEQARQGHQPTGGGDHSD